MSVTFHVRIRKEVPQLVMLPSGQRFIETHTLLDTEGINFSNGNAYLVLQSLRLLGSDGSLYGEVSYVDMLQRLNALVSKPVEVASGQWHEYVSAHFFDYQSSEYETQERLQRLLAYLLRFQDQNPDQVTWD